MAPLPLNRLAHFVLALLLAVGPALAAESESRVTFPQTSDDDQDDCDTELVAPTASRRAAHPKHTLAPFARASRLPGAPSRNLSVIGSTPSSRDPLGSRLRC